MKKRLILFFIADLLLVWAAFLFYKTNSFYISFLSKEAISGLFYVSSYFSLMSVISVFKNRQRANYKSNGYIFFETIYSSGRFLLEKKFINQSSIFTNNHDRTKFLFVLVKLFFIPIMLKFVIANCADLFFEIKQIHNFEFNISWIEVFNNVIYPFALSLFFFIDTALFTFGYLFESPLLRNSIRSVDISLIGWISALLCYPPFNDVTSRIAPFGSFNSVFFGTNELTFFARILMFCLIFFYMLASVSLGTKCSNLTNRGIVTKGVYRIVRHPAYISKVLFWWITIIPVIKSNLYVIVAMLAWTLIYFIRAVTEERHLSKDTDYIAYCKVVKYRFIPLIY